MMTDDHMAVSVPMNESIIPAPSLEQVPKRATYVRKQYPVMGSFNVRNDVSVEEMLQDAYKQAKERMQEANHKQTGSFSNMRVQPEKIFTPNS